MSRPWHSMQAQPARERHSRSNRAAQSEKKSATEVSGKRRRARNSPLPSVVSDAVSDSSDPWEISEQSDSESTFYTESNISSSESDSDSDTESETSAENDISRAPLLFEGESRLVSQQNLNVLDLETKLKVDDARTVVAAAPETAYSRGITGLEAYTVIGSGYSREYGSKLAADISAKIEYVDTSTSGSSSVRRDESVFRWLHLKQETMDFDIFSQCAQSLSGLPQEERHSLSRFIRRVRKDLETPIWSRAGRVGNVMKAGCIVKKNQTDKSKVNPRQDRSFVFCSLPYHQLTKYTPLITTRTAQSRLHPMMTLLQSRYPSTTKNQDLAQAVCFLDGTPPDHCFHALTLWCLTINNKYLITAASTLSAKEIAGDRVNWMAKMPTGPPLNPTGSLPEVLHVLVNDRLYILPLSQCDTWFAFTQNFSKFVLEFDEESIVHFRGHHITPELWPLVINRTRQELVCVLVSKRKRPLRPSSGIVGEGYSENDVDSDRLSVSSRSDLPAGKGKNKKSPSPDGASERPQSPNQANNLSRTTSPQPGAVDLREFHVLIWNAIRVGKSLPTPAGNADPPQLSPAVTIKVDNVTEPKPSKTARELVHTYLKSLDCWLDQQKDTKARALYEKVPQKTFQDVQRTFNGMVKAQLDNDRSQKLKTRLFECVKQVFQVFVPLDQRGTMCHKLWGAVHNAITSAIPKGPIVATINQITSILSETASIANKMKAQLSNGRACSPETLQIPSDALRAWHSFLLCLLFMSTKDIKVAELHAKRCQQQLQTAHRKLMKNSTATKLKDAEAMLPNGLATCIIDRVVTDFCGELPDVVESYWEYFYQLELKSAQQPRNRDIQIKLSALDAEVSLVIDSVKSQFKVVEDMEQHVFIDTANSERYFPDTYFHESPAHSILSDCISNLEGKSSSLSELRKRIENLFEKNAREMNNNKDQQEAAIYVFTIVTIIFLPVSTVATVLGMNTIDIRDMQKSQWVFWGSAVPLTAVVVFVSLFAAGVWQWPWKVKGEPRSISTREQGPLQGPGGGSLLPLVAGGKLGQKDP